MRQRVTVYHHRKKIIDKLVETKVGFDALLAEAKDWLVRAAEPDMTMPDFVLTIWFETAAKMIGVLVDDANGPHVQLFIDPHITFL